MMRQRLKSARKAAGMTQQQVADRLRISNRQYQRIEEGSSNGSFCHWDALEDLLGVSQRLLRVNQDKHHAQEENQSVPVKNRPDR